MVKRGFSAAQPRVMVKPDEKIQLLSDKFTKLMACKDKWQIREKELFRELCFGTGGRRF